jgi:hypothetical protein
VVVAFTNKSIKPLSYEVTKYSTLEDVVTDIANLAPDGLYREKALTVLVSWRVPASACLAYIQGDRRPLPPSHDASYSPGVMTVTYFTKARARPETTGEPVAKRHRSRGGWRDEVSLHLGTGEETNNEAQLESGAAALQFRDELPPSGQQLPPPWRTFPAAGR